MKNYEVKQAIKSRYSQCAEEGGVTTTCCCASEPTSSSGFAADHGLYSKEELSLVPELSRSLSRGCGNPTGFAELQPGEVVVDFGCGAGIDVILAAHRVSPGGNVVGVDFSPQMIDRARQAAIEASLKDVTAFVVADLERVDIPDDFADVVTSNCVINLCPDKQAVYREIFRVLKPGGRLAISDVVYEEKINLDVQAHFQETWPGCVGGSLEEDAYFDILSKAGFTELHVIARHRLPPKELEAMACCPGPEFTPAPDTADLDAVQGKVGSIKFTAIKPAK